MAPEPESTGPASGPDEQLRAEQAEPSLHDQQKRAF